MKNNIDTKKLEKWKILRKSLLITVLKLEPDILYNDDLKFRFGNLPAAAILFKYGVIAIDQNDLLVLGLNGSTPEHLAVKLINVLTRHCKNHRMNMGITRIDAFCNGAKS